MSPSPVPTVAGLVLPIASAGQEMAQPVDSLPMFAFSGSEPRLRKLEKVGVWLRNPTGRWAGESAYAPAKRAVPRSSWNDVNHKGLTTVNVSCELDFLPYMLPKRSWEEPSRQLGLFVGGKEGRYLRFHRPKRGPIPTKFVYLHVQLYFDVTRYLETRSPSLLELRLDHEESDRHEHVHHTDGTLSGSLYAVQSSTALELRTPPDHRDLHIALRAKAKAKAEARSRSRSRS